MGFDAGCPEPHACETRVSFLELSGNQWAMYIGIPAIIIILLLILLLT
jgi:hypothetical protein